MDNGFKDWGGYMDAKISKLEEQFAAASDPFRETNLFNGISIFVNGLTNPSSDELKRIMMVHGGTYHHYQRKNTTYIIATVLPDVKIRNMDTSKIISANWVTDCLKENRILDFTKYLLYTNQKTSQPRICFEQKTIVLDTDDDDDNDGGSVQVLAGLEELNEKMKIPAEDLPRDKADVIILDDIEETKSTFVNISSTSKGQPAKTAVDPKFLSEFYNNSRLHHIATLGTGFKQYISDLRESNSTEIFPARAELKKHIPKMEKYEKLIHKVIMHIDMDCFFVSVGLRKHQNLKGHPVAVTHSKGGKESAARAGVDRQLELELYMKRLETKLHENVKSDKIKNGFEGNESTSLSEIASCSYEARQLGIRNGMFVGHALKLCPDLQTIPYDFEGYKEVAFELYNTLAQYTLDIEAVSCDEMFVDLTDLLNDIQVGPMDFVTFVRNEVKRKTDCPCSAGVGGNRLQARMATKRAKPDGQFFLNPVLDSVVEYMADIPISDLPGVGHSTNYTLKQQSWRTCGDLQKISLGKLQMELGKKFGETLYQFCRGIDNRPLMYGQNRKSVSAEVNYGIRFTEPSEMETFLQQLCNEVHSRLVEIKRKGKCITLKLMVRSKNAPLESSKFMGHGVCDHISKSVTIANFTDDLQKISTTVTSIMRALNVPPEELRGLGIQITKLDEPNEEKAKKDNVIKNMFSKIIEKQKAEEKKNPETVLSNLDIQLPCPAKPEISPVKKTRGRKPKAKNNPKPSTSGGLLNMLQKSSVTHKRPAETCEFEGIDMDVLAELPPDIREEVLREQKYYGKASPTKNYEPPAKRIDVDIEFLEALPPHLRKEVEKEIASNKDKFSVSPKKSHTKTCTSTSDQQQVDINSNIISDDNIFNEEEASKLIEHWFKSTETPQECDVTILTLHFSEYVRARQIDVLYDPAVHFHNLVKESESCYWHHAYKSVILNLQDEMVKYFGGKMLLDENLYCDNCKN